MDPYRSLFTPCPYPATASSGGSRAPSILSFNLFRLVRGAAGGRRGVAWARRKRWLDRRLPGTAVRAPKVSAHRSSGEDLRDPLFGQIHLCLDTTSAPSHTASKTPTNPYTTGAGCSPWFCHSCRNFRTATTFTSNTPKTLALCASFASNTLPPTSASPISSFADWKNPHRIDGGGWDPGGSTPPTSTTCLRSPHHTSSTPPSPNKTNPKTASTQLLHRHCPWSTSSHHHTPSSPTRRPAPRTHSIFPWTAPRLCRPSCRDGITGLACSMLFLCRMQIWRHFRTQRDQGSCNNLFRGRI